LSIWMGMFLDWGFRSLLFGIRYFSGKWMDKKVI
jgi:Na+-driven multidrug efflux pump